MFDHETKRQLVWNAKLIRAIDDGHQLVAAVMQADGALEDFDEAFPAPNEALERAAQRHKDLVQPATFEVEKLQVQVAQLEAEKNGAYLERNQCVALIARMALHLGRPAGVTKTAIDGWDPEWYGCVFVDLPTGQASWHFHDSQAHLFAGLPAWFGTWDGHTTPQKYERVNAAFEVQTTAPAPTPVVAREAEPGPTWIPKDGDRVRSRLTDRVGVVSDWANDAREDRCMVLVRWANDLQSWADSRNLVLEPAHHIR